MAKISENDRRNYLEKIKTYSINADSLLKLEMKILSQLKQSPKDAPLNRFTLVDEMLNLSSNYIVINGISQSVLKVKDMDALNDGRKSLYKSVIYLEDIVSDLVDAPFSDYEEKLAGIESVNAGMRFMLARKMGLAIELLENAYGRNTKWKWAFVELEGRYAVAAKNMIDLRNAITNMEPSSPNYEPTVYHLRLVKKLFQQAADRYRERYELSTGRVADFQSGITFLSALRRLHILLYERDDADAIKKKMEIWSAKLEKDLKKAEESGSKKI